MVKATIDIPEEENRILNIVKGKYGFKNRQDALLFILRGFLQNLEPEIRPEYIKKIESVHKEKGTRFNNLDELRDIIEN